MAVFTDILCSCPAVAQQRCPDMMLSCVIMSCNPCPVSDGAAAICIRLNGTALSLQPLSITLQGITNDSNDPGVDIWRTATFPLIRRLLALGDADSLSLKVTCCRCCCTYFQE